MRTAAAATAGTLALIGFVTPAAHADTSAGDTVFSSLSFSRTTVGVGISAAQTLSVTATARDDSGIKVIAGFKLVSSDGRYLYANSMSCSRPTSTTMKCTGTYTLGPDLADSYYDLRNSSAGTWYFQAEAAAKDGDFYEIQKSAAFKVKRVARLANTQAGPEPVAKGGRLTVTGALTRANWDTNVYAGYGSKSVALQFKKSGSSSYTTVKTVTTDSSGKLRTTVTANASGTWRWKFAGASTTTGATAYGDSVALG
ncbi:calcium-binding protein [Streptomyces sp. NPDC001833]|uniref:calcium-binding protein n=1 Tax=Streptomyces sp. NPDC001833 TaxID=3154658 RepID=UPI0033233A13